MTTNGVWAEPEAEDRCHSLTFTFDKCHFLYLSIFPKFPVYEPNVQFPMLNIPTESFFFHFPMSNSMFALFIFVLYFKVNETRRYKNHIYLCEQLNNKHFNFCFSICMCVVRPMLRISNTSIQIHFQQINCYCVTIRLTFMFQVYVSFKHHLK